MFAKITAMLTLDSTAFKRGVASVEASMAGLDKVGNRMASGFLHRFAGFSTVMIGLTSLFRAATQGMKELADAGDAGAKSMTDRIAAFGQGFREDMGKQLLTALEFYAGKDAQLDPATQAKIAADQARRDAMKPKQGFNVEGKFIAGGGQKFLERDAKIADDFHKRILEGERKYQKELAELIDRRADLQEKQAEIQRDIAETQKGMIVTASRFGVSAPGVDSLQGVGGFMGARLSPMFGLEDKVAAAQERVAMNSERTAKATEQLAEQNKELSKVVEELRVVNSWLSE